MSMTWPRRVQFVFWDQVRIGGDGGDQPQRGMRIEQILESEQPLIGSGSDVEATVCHVVAFLRGRIQQEMASFGLDLSPTVSPGTWFLVSRKCQRWAGGVRKGRLSVRPRGGSSMSCSSKPGQIRGFSWWGMFTRAPCTIASICHPELHPTMHCE